MTENNEKYIKTVKFVKAYGLVNIIFLSILGMCIWIYDIKITHWITITNFVIIFLIQIWAYWKANKKVKEYEKEE